MENLDNLTHYINREYTTLAFNERVLFLAKDKRIPLLERMHYLCIFCSNLDEFFEIRVAGIKEKIALSMNVHEIDGLNPKMLLLQISEKAHSLYHELYETFNNQLLPALRQEKICFLSPSEWSAEILAWTKGYFKNDMLPIISPIALDLAHPFPRLFNKGLNFIVSLEGNDAFDRRIDYAVVHAPRALPRVIRVPAKLCQDTQNVFVHLSSIVQTHVHYLFPGMIIKGCYAFRLTRNSDLFLQEEEIDDLAVAMQHELFSRHFGHVVRLEIDKHCPAKTVHFLLQKHHLTPDDVYYCDGPVNLRRYDSIIEHLDRPDLHFPSFQPQYPQFIRAKHHLFQILDEQDILLHHPYQSFEVIADFVRQAAINPEVIAIKQTLYRTHAESAMVNALVEAARLGKEVTAVVELRARFDEESNLKLANRLHEAGVMVLYGVMGFKTHAKMTLVVKRTDDQLKRYVHLGTGNYHEKTAQIYTDIGLLTTNPMITQDVQMIFQQLTGLGQAVKLKMLSHAPFNLHKKLQNLILQCERAASEGIDSEIIIKVNGLTEQSIIDSLYQASQAGVHITLIVRSTCCLKPGIPGVSDNIRVISVLGRFLEHHRVYRFRIDGHTQYFCSSADLMERNLHHRIEIMFPILDSKNQTRIEEEIFSYYQKDDRFTWVMQQDGSYSPHQDDTFSAQEQLLADFSTYN